MALVLPPGNLYLKAFPWYSVDSSSWGQGFRFGNVPIFDERKGKFLKLSLGNHKSCYAAASLIRSYGFDPADFAERKRNDRAKICALSALAYIRAEQWLRKRHGEIYIPKRPDVTSVLKSHLALGGVLGTPDAPLGEYPRGLGMAHEATVQEDAVSVLKLHLVDSHATQLRDIGLIAEGVKDTVDAFAGLRTHLADADPQRFIDAKRGIDEIGTNTYLVDSPFSPLKDTASAARELQDNNSVAGIRQMQADTSNGINYHDADAGLKTYLADARGHSASEIAGADQGLRMYLAEHSLDRGGAR